MRRVLGWACLWLGACGCARALPFAVPDPEADALFTRHTAWRGGDSAYSVELDAGRVLWLFGDSWVGEWQPDSRANRRMTHNTVGVQQGKDPRHSSITFHGEPFFDDGDGSDATWLWPGPAVRLVGGVLVLLVEVRAVGEGTWGFRVQGSRAVLLEDVAGPPEAWVQRSIAPPPRPPGVETMGGALVENAFLYLFSVVEPGTHEVHLGRVALSEAARGELGGAQWFDGDGFGPARASRPILEGGQTEFTVHRSAAGPLWLVSTSSLRSADIVVRRAQAPQGPWSAPQVLYHPPLGDEPNVFAYSAKAHPSLSGPLRITYCTNHEDFWQMAARQELYFPRFLALGSP